MDGLHVYERSLFSLRGGCRQRKSTFCEGVQSAQKHFLRGGQGYKPNSRSPYSAMQNSIMTQWAPRAGWNSIFSAEEQQKGSDVFHNLIHTHSASNAHSVVRLTDATAETVVMMKMYQEKYPGLRYSEAQECILHQYVTPLQHHKAVARTLNPHAPPFTHREPRIHTQQSQQSQQLQPHQPQRPHTRTPYVALLSVHREQHKGQHGHKKENRLNEHPRHSESAVGQKRDGGTKEALKHPRSLGVRK